MLSSAGAQELGGLVYWAVLAAFLGVVLLGTYLDSAPEVRHTTRILIGTMVPLTIAAVLYVLLSALDVAILNGATGAVVVEIRVTVKLLTTTAYLILAMRWTGLLPDARPGSTICPESTGPSAGGTVG